MKVHRITQMCALNVVKHKFSTHIVQQIILKHQNEMFAKLLKCLNLVMKLHQRRFGSHLPVDPICLCWRHIVIFDNSGSMQKLLPEMP